MGAERDALWPYVQGLRHYDITGMPPGTHIGLPSPTVTMVLPLGAPLVLSMPGAERRALESCVAGLHTAPAAIHHDGTQRGIHVELSPLGVHALLGAPASELAGTALALDDLLGPAWARRLLDELAGAPDWPARSVIVRRHLTGRLSRDGGRRAPRPEVVRAWNLLAGSAGRARIRDVAADVGWSGRHLAQQFAAAVGSTPKSAGRLMRFSRSVTLIGRGTPVSDTAIRCGYADQAHLTREWGSLAGTTPARWLRVDPIANVQDAAGGRVRASRP